jgi:aryl sulfotransferase
VRFLRWRGQVCGLGYDPDLVKKAVAFSSFGELRRQEASAGFGERSPAAPGGFFRRGEVGSWRDELPGQLAERLTAAHHETMRRFGYAH